MLCVSKVEGWLARQRAAARLGPAHGRDCLVIRSSGHPGIPDGRLGGQLFVRPAAEEKSRRGGRDQPADSSGPLSGALALRLHLAIIPPGSRGRPHRHDARETAVFVVSGEAEVWYGPELGQRAKVRAGDVIQVPPGTPHLAVNRGEVPAVAVVASADPAEQAGGTPVDLPPHLDALPGVPAGGT
jgi:uncharacterized RmlC-like cupin family protein